MNYQFVWLDSLHKGITQQQQGKIRNNSSANLVFKICDVFANEKRGFFFFAFPWKLQVMLTVK